jgi:cytochrome c-type biogenesis protein CcmH
VLLALACVLMPLLRTPEPVATPPGRRWAFVLLVAIPLASYGLYRHLGAPAVLDAQPALQGKSHDVDAMLAALEKRLKDKPDDAEGWYVLGRSYLELQRLADAEAALERAVKLAPKEARMLAQYAEVVAVNDKGNLQGRARALVAEALELDPQEEKALELAGLSAYQREEWAQAAFYWRHLLKRLPPDSEFYQDIEKALKDARGRAEHSSGPGGGGEKPVPRQ